MPSCHPCLFYGIRSQREGSFPAVLLNRVLVIAVPSAAQTASGISLFSQRKYQWSDITLPNENRLDIARYGPRWSWRRCSGVRRCYRFMVLTTKNRKVYLTETWLHYDSSAFAGEDGTFGAVPVTFASFSSRSLIQCEQCDRVRLKWARYTSAADAHDELALPWGKDWMHSILTYQIRGRC